MNAKIEKRTGWDWLIIYQMDDEPYETMDVFGSMTIEDAAREAHYSLSPPKGMEGEYDYQIVAVIRNDRLNQIREGKI